MITHERAALVHRRAAEFFATLDRPEHAAGELAMAENEEARAEVDRDQAND